MKIFLFFLFFFLYFWVQLPAQTHRQAIKQGHGAQTEQEIGTAVFKSFKENRFQNLENYFPDEVELRVLRRRSSKDMQLVLEKTTPESLKQNLQENFNQVVLKATDRRFNWNEWQLTNVEGMRRDRKDPLLYTVKLTLANGAGAEETLWFEAIKVRRRFYLFKQLEFNPAPEAGARND